MSFPSLQFSQNYSKKADLENNSRTFYTSEKSEILLRDLDNVLLSLNETFLMAFIEIKHNCQLHVIFSVLHPWQHFQFQFY